MSHALLSMPFETVTMRPTHFPPEHAPDGRPSVRIRVPVSTRLQSFDKPLPGDRHREVRRVKDAGLLPLCLRFQQPGVLD